MQFSTAIIHVTYLVFTFLIYGFSRNFNLEEEIKGFTKTIYKNNDKIIQMTRETKNLEKR